MKKEKISIGSIVKIKGQDIKMTVENIIKPSLEQELWNNPTGNKIHVKAECVWFVDQILHRDIFTIESLSLENNN